MLAHGNGDSFRCANNILKTVRGEVPYERLLGVSADYIDHPASAVLVDQKEDIEWAIKTYEARVEIDRYEELESDAENGEFRTVPVLWRRKVCLHNGDCGGAHSLQPENKRQDQTVSAQICQRRSLRCNW